MLPIPSSLTSQVKAFAAFRDIAAERGFVLGGNWDYDRGSFDCALDEAQQVWVRLPFQITVGSVDSESDDSDARILLGEPYVLKHVYQEHPDPEARTGMLGAVLTQFSDPADPDAEVEPRWAEAARRKIGELEQTTPG